MLEPMLINNQQVYISNKYVTGDRKLIIGPNGVSNEIYIISYGQNVGITGSTQLGAKETLIWEFLKLTNTCVLLFIVRLIWVAVSYIIYLIIEMNL